MRVVIVGASGFLGNALAQAFSMRGTELLCTARDADAARAKAAWNTSATRWISADFSALPSAAFWARHLQPGDVVINAAGLLRERHTGELDAVHHLGPIQLFDACVQVGAALVIQISALGADDRAISRYHRSKAAGDRHLRQCPIASVIVQPSLVWGDRGASAQLFAALAVLPWLALPAGGRQPLQPVHVDDLVDGVLALADIWPRQLAASQTIAFVGPQPVTLRAYLADLRQQLGYVRGARVFSVPEGLFRWGAALAGRWPRSFLDPETATMLLQGNAAPADDFARCLGRQPRAHHTFIPNGAGAAEAMRRAAWLRWALPMLRWAVAFVWIWTFVVSIGLYPRDQSLELLAQVGTHGALAELLLNGAAIFDLALGIGTLALSADWRSRFLWPFQLALIAFYTAMITWAMPDFWLHPFGPLSKNLPMCAAIVLLWAMEPPARSRRTQRSREHTPVQETP